MSLTGIHDVSLEETLAEITSSIKAVAIRAGADGHLAMAILSAKTLSLNDILASTQLEVTSETNGTSIDNAFQLLKGARAENGKYSAIINRNGKCQYLGCYELKSDAAMAFDEAAKLFVNRSKLNFRTKEEHVDMRNREMKITGIDIKLEAALAKISAKVNEFAAKNGVSIDS